MLVGTDEDPAASKFEQQQHDGFILELISSIIFLKSRLINVFVVWLQEEVAGGGRGQREVAEPDPRSKCCFYVCVCAYQLSISLSFIPWERAHSDQSSLSHSPSRAVWGLGFAHRVNVMWFGSGLGIQFWCLQLGEGQWIHFVSEYLHKDSCANNPWCSSIRRYREKVSVQNNWMTPDFVLNTKRKPISLCGVCFQRQWLYTGCDLQKYNVW